MRGLLDFRCRRQAVKASKCRIRERRNEAARLEGENELRSRKLLGFENVDLKMVSLLAEKLLTADEVHR